MRPFLALLSVTLLLTVAPAPASAQPEAGPVQVASDGTGDPQLYVGGTPQSAPAEATSGIDLVALTAQEDQETITFTLQVAGLGEDTEGPWSGYGYTIDFIHHDQAYRVYIYQGWAFSIGGSSQAGTTYSGYLAEYDPGTQESARIATTDPVVDEDANTFTVTVDRDLLIDSSGAFPFPGRTLSDFKATASSFDFLCDRTCTIMDQTVPEPYAMDHMPDDGTSETPLPITYGIKQSGHARLASTDPFRYSNGAASTFVFTVAASNVADDADTFRLTPVALPGDWDVRVPSSVIEIEAGKSIDVPVVLRTPFAHEHGDRKSFLMEMRSETDDRSVGRVELGILYPEVPQPAGHHNTLHLHSWDGAEDPVVQALETALRASTGFEFARYMYMNTVADHEASDGVPVGPGNCYRIDILDDATKYCWNVPLVPSLKMGLDFDVAEAGTIEASFQTIAPLQEARLTGRLVYLGEASDPDRPWDRERIVLADLEPDGTSEIGAASSGTLAATIVPTEDADLIPYHPDGSLVLEAELLSSTPDNDFIGPRNPVEMLPGGSMRLPLLEYEDPVSGVFGTQGVVSLLVPEQHRLVNPSEVVLFRGTLKNDGPVEDAFSVRLSGQHQDWARLVTAQALTLAAGDSREVVVAVHPAAAASDGDRADLILEAQSASDAAARALVRLVAEVDEDQDHADEGAELDVLAQEQESPALPWLVLLVAMAGLAARRRRP